MSPSDQGHLCLGNAGQEGSARGIPFAERRDHIHLVRHTELD